jgi:hypothetical protein
VPRKATTLSFVRRSVPADGVVGESEIAVVVGLVQAHVDPGAVLLVPFFRRALAILWPTCCCWRVFWFARSMWPLRYWSRVAWQNRSSLVVYETILYAVQFVDVLHNCLAIILDKVLDKSISADGNTKTNVAVNYKGRRGEQGA